MFGIAQTNPFGLGGSSSFEFIDIDGDGDLDAFGDIQFFRNTGTANSPEFSNEGVGSFGLPGYIYRGGASIQSFVDIDGDGDLDAFVTGTYSYGNDYTWQSFLINNNAPNVANLTAPETYTRNTLLNLTDIVISDSDSATVTAL